MPTNEERAGRIADTLAYYKGCLLGENGEPELHDLKDMLTDIRHYCHQHEIDLTQQLTSSEIHFEEEK